MVRVVTGVIEHPHQENSKQFHVNERKHGYPCLNQDLLYISC